MSFAIKWKYEHFQQQRVTEKLFSQRYQNFDFARRTADNTFWEHRVGGVLIARVSAEVVRSRKTKTDATQTDVFEFGQ
jgi:ABC-type sulfate transport system substrate-binding protein